MHRKLRFEILGRESINIDKTRSLGPQHDDRLNNLIPSKYVSYSYVSHSMFHNTRNLFANTRDT